MRRDVAFVTRFGPLVALIGVSWLIGTQPALGANPLAIAIAGPVDDSAYPTVSVTLSIVDGVTGRPVTALDASSVAVQDSAGPATVEDVTGSSASVPSAYVLELDTSGSMLDAAGPGQSYMERAKVLARAFVAGLGPGDLVRLVTFDAAPKTKTGWLKRDDPALGAAIGAVQAEHQPTRVSAALVAASLVADGRPQGIDRRAVVLITDTNPADKDANLSVGAMRSKLGPPAFVIGLRPARDVGPELGQLLSDVATYTGGAYVAAGPKPDPSTLFKAAWMSTRATWTVRVRTDAAPDGASHDVTLVLTDALQRAGRVTFTYRSGHLLVVSPLVVGGLANGDDLTTDRTVTFAAGGRAWRDARIDLFLDCDPGACAPLLTADGGPLSWRIIAGALAQGSHTAIVRLTVHDSQSRQYSDQLRIAFLKSGTTINLEVAILIGGIALVAISATFTAMQRRRRRSR